MATPSTILSVGANTSQLERDVQKALQKLERGATFAPKINSKGFALGRITGEVNQFNESLEAANKRIIAFGANAAVIGGIIKGFSELASATIRVEKSLIEINAVFGASEKELKTFSEGLFDIGRQTAQSFDIVAKSAQEFARQGLGVEDTLKRVNGALTLTRQSGLEVGKSIDSITAALNGYAKESLSVEKVVNSLIAVDTRFAVSAGDLAEAISRVGSTAQEAGVSFDELIGLVTSAQQITARGGAVIGNAFKTIFTRVQRDDTQSQLEALGVTVKDLQGNTLPAIKILQNLAKSLDGLSESQQRSVTELTAGVFQINQLKAVLGDLSNSYSIAEQATKASSSATNEAVKRNVELNKSLDAVIQNTKTTFTEIASIIGENTFAEPLRKALNVLNSTLQSSDLEIFRGAQGETQGKEYGAFIAKGILQGIENILSGPGLVAALGVIVNVGGRALRGLLESIKSLATSREKELLTVQGIERVLASANQLDQQRYVNATSIEQKEKVILQLLEQQTVARRAQAAADKQLVNRLPRTQSFEFRQIARGANAAGGFLPVGAEKAAISKGVGGAPRNAKPVVIPNFAFGGGKYGSIVANNSEYIVPNFANGGSAVFNQEMVQKYGLPKGAKKIAAGGYVPNFNNDLFSYLDEIDPAFKQSFSNLERKDPTLAKFIADNIDKNGAEGMREYYNLFKKKKQNIQVTPKSANFARSNFLDLADDPANLRKKISDSFDGLTLAGGYIPNFALPGFDQFIGKGAFGKVSRGSGENKNLVFKKFEGVGVDNIFGSPEAAIENEFRMSKKLEAAGIPVAKVLGSLPKAVSQGGIIKEFVQGIGGKTIAKEFPDLYRGIRSTLRGRTEAAGIKAVDLRDDNFISQFNKNELNLLSNLLKNSGSSNKYNSLTGLAANKSKIIDPGLFQEYAKGYIPNFADPIQEAIKRETKAGVPMDQIYLDQDKRVKSPQNPEGLLIANKRDEPKGGKQGVDRVLRRGGDPKRAGAYSSGYIPNFAESPFSREQFTARGEFISKEDLNSINELFSALDNVNGAKFKAITQEIRELTTEFNKSASQLVSIKLARRIKERNRVPTGGVTEPDFSAFDKAARPSGNSDLAERLSKEADDYVNAFFGNKKGGEKLPPPTNREIALKKPVTELSNEQLKALLGQTGNESFGRSEDIKTSRSILGQRSVIGRGNKREINTDLINSTIGLGRSGTLNTQFEAQVKQLIDEGKTLERSYGLASKTFIESGGSAKQLSKAQVGYVNSLVNYEKATKEAAAQQILKQQEEKKELVSNRNTKSRQQVFSSITNKTISGEELKGGERRFLESQFQSQGRDLAKTTLSPDASKAAVDTFVKKYTQEQFKVLDDAFQQSVKANLDQSILQGKNTRFNQIYSDFGKSKGIKGRISGLFANQDRAAESIISKNNLTGEAANQIRQKGSARESQRQGRLQTAGFAASFALPFAAGFVDPVARGLGFQTRGGTTSGQVTGGLSGALQGAGTGAALGSFFGPLGTAIGGIGGGIAGGVVGAINKANVSFEELSRTISELNSRTSSQIESASRYIQIQQQLNDAIQRGAPSRQVNTLIGQQRQSLGGVRNIEDRRSLLNAGGDIQKLSQALSDINERAAKQTAGNDVISSLGSARENAGFFKGLKGKDIEDSAQALASAVDLSSDKVKGSLEKLRTNFKDNPLQSLGSLVKDLGIDSDLAEETIKSFRSKPEELGKILGRFVEVFDENAEQLSKVEKNARKETINIDFARLLSRAGEQNIIGADSFQRSASSQNRLIQTRQGAANSLGSGPSIERIRQENQLNIQNAVREASIQAQAATQRNVGELQSFAGTNRGTIQDDILEKIANVQGFDDIKKLLETIPNTNDLVYKEVSKAYNELIAINQSSQLQITELKEIARISEIQSRVEERNKVLAGSQFQPGNVEGFFQSRLAGKTGQFARGGKANQFNALTSQIDFADSLGLSETNNTESLRNLTRGKSANINFAEILSTILDETITDDPQAIKNAIAKAMKKPVENINDAIDKDVVQRIEQGINSLKFTDQDAFKELSSGSTAKSFGAGKISLAESGVIGGLSKLESPLQSIQSNLGVNGPIAEILKQIRDNRQAAEFNKKFDDLNLSIDSIKKQIDERNTNIESTRLNSIGFSGLIDSLKSQRTFEEKTVLGPGQFSFPQKTNVATSETIKIERLISVLEKQQGKGVSISDALSNIKGDQNLLNEINFGGDELKSVVEKAVSSKVNVGTFAEKRDQDEIVKLKKDLKKLEDQVLDTQIDLIIDAGKEAGKFFSELGNGFAGAFSKNTPKTNPIIPSATPIVEPTRANFSDYVGGQLKDAPQGKAFEAETKAAQESVNQSKQALKRADDVNVSYRTRISILQELNDDELELARTTNNAAQSFAAGFKSQILELQKSMFDLSDVGRTVANSLESNLGNAFGDFVTGAKTGKEAFRDFTLGILNDAARAFASKAVQQLIGGIAGSFTTASTGGKISGKATGGKINSFNNGGSVPALVMGGEYYFTPQQVRNVESNYGPGYLDQMNKGQVPMYAGGGSVRGGMIRGGSGTKDDVFAMLDNGGYVIRKSAVNKYGSNTLEELKYGGKPGKHFWGALIGAGVGAASGYFGTKNKKDRGRNALIGAGLGALAGYGVERGINNYQASGNILKSAPVGSGNDIGSSFNTPMKFSAGKLSYSSSANPQTGFSAAGSGGGSPYTAAFANAGIAGVLGIGSALLQKKDTSAEDTSWYNTTGKQLREQEAQFLLDSKDPRKSAFLEDNPQGGQNIRGYGYAPATRRFNKGGAVNGGSGVRDDIFTRLQNGGYVLNKQATSKIGNSKLNKMASGGMVNVNTYAEGGSVGEGMPEMATVSLNNDSKFEKTGSANAPQVYIKIDINNQGDTSSSSESSGNGQNEAFGEDFAKKLERTIRNTVQDELVQQDRVGGMNSKLRRSSQ
jgi:TP901 family phage tail tape measure protein